MGPYISRGVITTREVYESIASRNFSWSDAEKFVQELAWRDYWQQIWVHKKEGIQTDLKNTQIPISNYEIPTAIVEATTGITAVDSAIKELYITGYMHNHMRMYIASICCNVAHSHWLEPARWMYAHLLDGDLASNQLSWQWVAGAFSNKKYYANQENINHFFNSTQKDTFLDIDYEQFAQIKTPKVLEETTALKVDYTLPTVENSSIKNEKTLIYNYYNLDYNWYKADKIQRVLLLEPSTFRKYPISQSAIDFMMKLSKNIEGLQLFVGEFEELTPIIHPQNIRFKEHPLNNHYVGTAEERNWLSSVKGYYPSFFAFWKKCKKELKW